jgi:hypothetical protein
MMDRVRERNFLQQDEDTWDDPMEVDGYADTESDCDEYPEIPEEFIETVCTGINDIVITGEVRSSPCSVTSCADGVRLDPPSPWPSLAALLLLRSCPTLGQAYLSRSCPQVERCLVENSCECSGRPNPMVSSTSTTASEFSAGA